MLAQQIIYASKQPMINAIDSLTVKFEELLFELLDDNLALDIERFRLSHDLCELSFEYWMSLRYLLLGNQFPASAIIARTQFESIVKAIWVLNCATNTAISKLNAELNENSEESAKNMPGVHDMMNDLRKGADKNAYDALLRFKHNSWNALNSYTHAGIHPIYRIKRGYPEQLIISIYRNSNGMAVMAAMNIVILHGRQDLQKKIIQLSEKYKECMPKYID